MILILADRLEPSLQQIPGRESAYLPGTGARFLPYGESGLATGVRNVSLELLHFSRVPTW